MCYILLEAFLNQSSRVISLEWLLIPSSVKGCFFLISSTHETRPLGPNPLLPSLTSSHIVSLEQFAASAEFAAALLFAKYLTCKAVAFS